jgi:exodeoxyribonuclease VII small subunit
MSKAAKSTPGATPENTDVPFEEALTRLESIVQTMEGDDLSLETLLQKYEQGSRLARICQAKLAEAELKIKQLEKNAAGDLVLKPLALTDEPAKE